MIYLSSTAYHIYYRYDGPQVGNFEFDQVDIFKGASFKDIAHFAL